MILYIFMDAICFQGIDGSRSRAVLMRCSQGPHNGTCGIGIRVLFEMLSLLCLF